MVKNFEIKADHVGSFLRTNAIKQAREHFRNGDITKDQLWEIENAEIDYIIRKQAEAGLKVVTDGEFRRSYFHFDFMFGCEGVELVEGRELVFNNNIATKPETVVVTDKVTFGNHPIVKEFEVTNRIAKKYNVEARVAVPSPNTFIYREVTDQERDIYPTEEDLFQDLVKVYQDLILALYEKGCRHLQFDDTAWNTFFNDEPGLFEFKGIERDRALKLFLKTTNDILSVKPNDMLISMHVCRGNYKSEHLTSGSYAPVADVLFGQLDYDALLLEFDDERSGELDVLKYATKEDQRIVLGFITSKKPELENKDAVIDRIKEASEFVALERLAISPQCGFASTEEGNNLTEEEQWNKVKLIIDIADSTWKKATESI